LVVTSRVEQRLDGKPTLVVEPSRLAGAELARFITDYAQLRDKAGLLPKGQAFFKACGEIVRMEGPHADRGTTALLAKQYADYLIARSERPQGDDAAKAPENVPELMLSYVSTVNE